MNDRDALLAAYEAMNPFARRRLRETARESAGQPMLKGLLVRARG